MPRASSGPRACTVALPPAPCFPDQALPSMTNMVYQDVQTRQVWRCRAAKAYAGGLGDVARHLHGPEQQATEQETRDPEQLTCHAHPHA